jgi:hypothetical protein
MDDQRTMIETDQQIFAAPSGGTDPLATQALGQTGWKGPAQTAVTQYDAGNDTAFEMRRDTAAGNFHFRQFRHCSSKLFAKRQI